jgi:5-formyltetrahydrofolate cyclo-ligase
MPGSVHKAQIRQRVWALLTQQGVALFPGAFGRTPRFQGQDRGIAMLRDMPQWHAAERILVQPDQGLEAVRRQVLADGKTLIVPDLTRTEPGWILEVVPGAAPPEFTPGVPGREPQSRLGHRYLPGAETAPVDLMIVGAVAVDRRGTRIGRGIGSADLVYALGRDRGFVRPETPVAVLVHPLQFFDEQADREPTDLPIDFVVTPDEVVAVQAVVMRPKGLHPRLITPERLDRFPGLRRILEREGIELPPAS